MLKRLFERKGQPLAPLLEKMAQDVLKVCCWSYHGVGGGGRHWMSLIPRSTVSVSVILIQVIMKRNLKVNV